MTDHQPDLLDMLESPSSVTWIGERRPERLTCGPLHLPACYNPNSFDTWCDCGAVRWPGQVGTWHSIPRREPYAPPLLGVGIGAPGLSHREPPVLGWDTYFMHADGCPDRGVYHTAGRCFVEATS